MDKYKFPVRQLSKKPPPKGVREKAKKEDKRTLLERPETMEKITEKAHEEVEKFASSVKPLKLDIDSVEFDEVQTSPQKMAFENFVEKKPAQIMEKTMEEFEAFEEKYKVIQKADHDQVLQEQEKRETMNFFKNLFAKEDPVERKEREEREREAIKNAGVTQTPIGMQFGIFDKEMIAQPENPHSLRIGVVGAANAGKSTLLNALIGEKVSIVSPKAQTTREPIQGILSHENIQILFFDTPGIVPKSEEKRIARDVVKSAWQTISTVDAVLVVVDAVKRVTSEYTDLLVRLKEEKGKTKDIPFICVLNKVDLGKTMDGAKKMEKVKEIVKGTEGLWDVIFEVSSLYKEGVDDVRSFLMLNAKPREWEYPAKVKTDQPHFQQVAEIIREKIMNYVYHEVPYVAKIVNGGWNATSEGTQILQYIFVQKEGQKAILLGAGGGIIRKIQKEATLEIEKILKTPVNLRLIVKVKPPEEDEPIPTQPLEI